MSLAFALLLAPSLGDGPPPDPPVQTAVADTVVVGLPSGFSHFDDVDPGPLGALARSTVLPGWGQRAYGQSRGWLYLAAEIVAWAGYADARSAGASARRAYRDLAWESARLGVSDGPRIEGPWEYYETMSTFSRSGRFDRAPHSPHLLPEDDQGSYNGLVWRLAREIHLPAGAGADPQPGDPGWDEALEYYRNRAIRPEFAWDWGGDLDAVSRFGGLIERSDQRYRRATTFAGALLANRFLSGVDAYLSAIASRPSPLPALDLQTRLTPTPAFAGGGWTLSIRMSLPKDSRP